MNKERTKIKVGNLNDYNQILNRINVLENVDLTIDDFVKLGEKYDGEYMAYSIGSADDEAMARVRINRDQVINFYSV